MSLFKHWILQTALSLSLIVSLVLPAFGRGGEGGEGGTADGGGDFAYYSSGVRNLQRRATNELIYGANGTPLEFFDEVFAPYQVNPQRLVRILKNVEERLADTRFRKNPEGYLEPLHLDFGLNDQGEEAIFILPGFYDWGVRRLEQAGRGYDRLKAEEALRHEMMLKLFKEALHHFGIINDDLARDYALFSKQLGYSGAARQLQDCARLKQRYPEHACLKSWEAGYWEAAKEIEAWESDKLGAGTVILASSEGLLLEIDLTVKAKVQVQEPKYRIHGIGECVERWYERTDCSINNEIKDGRTHRLRSAFRISLKYEKENDFEIPLRTRKPIKVTYSVGGDREDEVGTVTETKVILRRNVK